MTKTKIVKELKALGSDSTKRILMNHGATEPVFGVKISELKKLQKQIRGDYELALELYDTGIYDAQYLAGLATDDSRMTKKDLRGWLKNSNCPSISSSVVAWVAAESSHGTDLAMKWIESKQEDPAQTGWTTLSSLVSIKDDSELDLPELKRQIQHIKKTIHKQPNLVRYAMNGFVIAAGCFVESLTDTATQAAEKYGTVMVDMGNTSCAVPSAVDYIKKVEKRGTIGKKRKTAKC